jgi:hypothetical protein
MQTATTLTLLFLQCTITYVAHVAPEPNEHSLLMSGQAPPKVKHSCTLLAALQAMVLLTLSTPVGLLVLMLTYGVTAVPLRVAEMTLPLQPSPVQQCNQMRQCNVNL